MGDIYLLECPNGKKYVGQTVKYLKSGKKWGYLARWNAHINEAKRCLNYCRLLDNAIRKYGYENFKLTLICECSTFSELNDKEKYFIKELNTLSPNGYNLTSGGKLYVFFQIIYLSGALFFTYVQWQILQTLKTIQNKQLEIETNNKDTKTTSLGKVN
jgi:group I intron endonuclease